MGKKTINLFVHGSSEGFNSELIQFLYKELKKVGKDCYGFDFEYIKNKAKPSDNNVEEIKELRKIISAFEKKGYQQINLIGKSMGGIISLHKDIISDPKINKIIILGFPVKLGYPIDLKLLARKPFIPKLNYRNEYIKHLNKINHLSSKIAIVQGLKDLLGSKEDIDNINSDLKNKLHIKYLDNAMHGFYPLTEETNKENNFKKVLSLVNKWTLS